MANYCNYEVRVKGTEKACLMVFASMPFMDDKELEWQRKEKNLHLMSFTGNCKWSVNYGVRDTCNRINVNSMSDSEIQNRASDFLGCSLRAKSEAFQCEIMVHYWSDESDFDQFDHYKNGKVLKQRKIPFNYEEQTEFDWKQLEFVGHVGEYDESVDGEQQNANFMAMLSALGGKQVPQNSETENDEDYDMEDFEKDLRGLMNSLEDLADEAGIELKNSAIGDTRYDLYQWTFTEGKRKAVKGWSIAIPDGFSLIESKENRLFEAVPCGMENNAPESVPVRILPSIAGESDMISGELWTYHPYTRAAAADMLEVEKANAFAQITGDFPEIVTTGFSDICAATMIQDTSGGSYSYLTTVYTEGKFQQLRVQTRFVTDKQKERLTNSIIAWVETFRFDAANPSAPKEPVLASAAVLDDLKRGKTASFENAVDRTCGECSITVNGRMKTLQYHAEHGLVNEDLRDAVRKILTRGMEVLEFYYQTADQLVEKLKTLSLKASIMDKVYEKLDDLKDAIPPCSVDGKKVTVSLPPKVKDIQNKWKKEANELQQKLKAEEKERQKAAQEKYKEELRKYNDAHKKWESECAAIEAKRSASVDAQIAKEKANILHEAKKTRDKEIAKAKATLKKERKRKEQAEASLASLGVFHFSAKKAQKTIIEEATRLLTEAEASKSAAEATYAAEISNADKKAEACRSKAQKAAEEAFKLPNEPKKPN